MEKTYRIVRFFKYSGDSEIKATGCTLTDAQDWCCDPASRDDVNGWFDGYEVEQ
jgi:hypothetical protein